MAEEGAAQEAAHAAENLIKAATALGDKAVDLTADTVRDVVTTLLRTAQRLTDAALGPGPRE